MHHVVGFAGEHAVRAAGDVDGRVREGFVHRDEAVAEPTNTALVAERLVERVTEDDRGVLDGVVCLDLDVAWACTVRSNEPC